tara:strand:+ start:235 stop:1857 length:1623 start_codon:yes stop_codon:yes gene_type:complete
MPNSIKYNTESEANALGIGNMHIGTGDVPKGPTSSTGFYNGINPPNGGYTIYLNKSTQGPSIYTPSSDAELISVTNGIAGASYTTINECFNYFAGQDDKIVMHNPINYLVTDDLAFYVNAGVIPSYPHNNNTWYDLGEDNNNGTLTNGPTFNSNGYLDFDGVDDYITLGSSASSLVQGKTSISMGILFKLDALDSLRGLIGTLNYNCQKNLGLTASGTTLQFYNDNTSCNSVSINGGAEVDKWIYAVGTYDGTTTRLYCLKDGNLTQASGTSKSGATNTFTSEFRVMGPFHSYRTNGQCANAFVYNKTLTEAEILQNYFQSPIVTDGLVFAADAGNLVSYENGDTTTHSLTGSVEGTLTNGVSFNGNSGGIWEFDGVDDYIAINNLGLSSHTIEGWFNSDDGSQGGDGYATICSIFGNYDGGSAKYTYIGLIPNLTFRIDNGATSHAGIATVSYTANTWYHVALTYDATSGVAKAYVNGDEVGSKNSTTNITFNSIPHNIAKTQVNVHFDGEVALHRTYNRALTEGEILQNYNANINRFN